MSYAKHMCYVLLLKNWINWPSQIFRLLIHHIVETKIVLTFLSKLSWLCKGSVISEDMHCYIWGYTISYLKIKFIKYIFFLFLSPQLDVPFKNPLQIMGIHFKILYKMIYIYKDCLAVALVANQMLCQINKSLFANSNYNIEPCH